MSDDHAVGLFGDPPERAGSRRSEHRDGARGGPRPVAEPVKDIIREAGPGAVATAMMGGRVRWLDETADPIRRAVHQAGWSTSYAATRREIWLATGREVR